MTISLFRSELRHLPNPRAVVRVNSSMFARFPSRPIGSRCGAIRRMHGRDARRSPPPWNRPCPPHVTRFTFYCSPSVQVTAAQ